MTVSEQLRAIGYGHRQPAIFDTDRRQFIYQLDTGDIVGRMDAQEAAEWVKNPDRLIPIST